MKISPVLPTTVLALLSLLQLCSSARILLFAPGYGGSHILFHRRLADAIARGGHQVLSLEPEYAVDPRAFQGPALAKRLIVNGPANRSRSQSALGSKANGALFGGEDFRAGLPQMCEQVIARPGLMDELRRWRFDAYLYEPFTLCPVGIARVLGIRTQITFTSQPALDEQKGGLMASLWERATGWRTSVGREYSALFSQHFGADFAEIEQSSGRAQLHLVNSNQFLEFPRPLPPNAVRIAGIGLEREIDEGDPLEAPFDALMATGREGVILVSFGTHILTTTMPTAVKRNLLDAFSTLPNYQFIWKVDKANVHSMRTMAASVPNVHITGWQPQAKLLAHPRLRLFISHTGFNSLTEAAWHGVPVLAIPFVCPFSGRDQQRNADLAVRNGWALRLERRTLLDGHGQLRTAVLELLSNPSYAKSAQRTKRLMKALPLSAEQNLHTHLELLLSAGEGHLHELGHSSAGEESAVPVFELLAAAATIYFVTRTVLLIWH